jgi:hypothetical protein
MLRHSTREGFDMRKILIATAACCIGLAGTAHAYCGSLCGATPAQVHALLGEPAKVTPDVVKTFEGYGPVSDGTYAIQVAYDNDPASPALTVVEVTALAAR